ncbi:YqiA/YcfP family alpha/beta fold hydrolase [uncultured Thiohalocapsa sp.]|uniref:YqiA/YcfP family alpha/beta fold hydrolase n=1 Tax=uncultured Thiohalocapsa sp. TaxID=768990 RepID=UPI0025D6DA09|nr:YqiA/YcfP family alpha/beta fold hydrolase [uncultured Thiohalocapsa sp.]
MGHIFYLHGFASGPKPQSPKVALLRELGHQVRCLDTGGNYRSADYLNALYTTVRRSAFPDLLVGTSLGGFWARYFGVQLDCPWVALNPALHPSQTLARTTGTLQRFDVDATFAWSDSNASAYLPFEDRWLDSEVPGLIIAAADDDVVDAEETRRLCGRSRFVKLPRGGHALANIDDYADLLADFIASVVR